jgi:hypothetical protein
MALICTFLFILLSCSAIGIFQVSYWFQFTFFVLFLTIQIGLAQQPCNNVMITANKLQCQTLLGAWGTEANCVAMGTEMVLIVHFLSTTFLESSAEGYGHGHILEGNGE